MRQTLLASLAVTLGLLTVTQADTWKTPRTSWGDPDLQGVWNYATMTSLERPRELAAKETLTAEEADAFEQQTRQRRDNTNNTAGPDWWDGGTNALVDRRTSLIVDPANGRVPPLTPEGQRKAAARAQARRERGPADSAQDLALNERCILWSTAGPPMLPGPYNNNVQIVQTRGLRGPRQRDDPRRTHHPDGRSSTRRHPSMDGRFARTLGRRHAGRGHDRLHGQVGVPRVRRTPPSGRAIHPQRREDDSIPLHRRRPGDVDEPMDRGVSIDGQRRADLRVRLSRGERAQHAGHPARRADAG